MSEVERVKSQGGVEDYQDLQDLRSAKQAEATTTATPLADVVNRLGLDNG